MEVMVRFEDFKSGDGLRGTAGLHEMPRRRSEIELQSQLNIPWILRRVDQTHAGTQGRTRRSVQVDVIECVDEVCSELEPHRFCDVEILLQAEVQISGSNSQFVASGLE